MHKEILTREQVDLLPLIQQFSSTFRLVGGTAIALYLGHRRSIDFDLFSDKSFHNLTLRKKITSSFEIQNVIIDQKGEYTIALHGVKLTFLEYPYRLEYPEKLNDIIHMPDLLTLAAMKAHALGRRAKWKDYSDLYFISKTLKGVSEIIQKAKTIFQDEFNEKIFRAQLAYFDDMDYSEEIVYMPGSSISNETIQKELVNISLS